MSPTRSWLQSWEVYLAVAVVVGATVLHGTQRMVTLSDVGLWSGGIVLGTGLLRDLHALWVTRPGHGAEEVAMCVESIVGVAAIAAGLVLVILPLLAPTVPGLAWRLSGSAIGAGLGACLVFSAWVHDLVIVKRGGHLSLLRHPDHGSFVVHLVRGRAKACLIGEPPGGEKAP